LAAIVFGAFCKNQKGLFSRAAGSAAATAALIITTSYLFLGIVQNSKAEELCKKQLLANGENSYLKINAYTTMFHIFHRRLVVEDDKTLRIGSISTIDPKEISWFVVKKPDNLPSTNFLNDSEVKIMAWFANQNYSLSYDAKNMTVTLIDNRFSVPYSANNTDIGYWGIRFQIDEKGNKIGPATFFNNKPRVPMMELADRIMKKFF